MKNPASIAKPLKVAAGWLPPSLQRLLRRAVAARRDRDVIVALADLNAALQWEAPCCAVCDGLHTRIHTSKNGFRIVECLSDGLLFVSPRPTDVKPYYDLRYYRGGFPGVYQSYETHATQMEPEWSKRLDLLGKRAPAGQRLLDVGAATGDFVALAGSRGWTARGIELSEWAAIEARKVHNVDVVSGSLPDPRFQAEDFDVVTLWDCIEHLSNPKSVLDATRQLLRTDGILALSTGAVEHRDPLGVSGWYFPPWHLYYFSKQTITRLLERTGFEIIDYMVQHPDSPYAIMTVIARPHTRRPD